MSDEPIQKRIKRVWELTDQIKAELFLLFLLMLDLKEKEDGK